jgi:hypothetical protein
MHDKTKGVFGLAVSREKAAVNCLLYNCELIAVRKSWKSFGSRCFEKAAVIPDILYLYLK